MARRNRTAATIVFALSATLAACAGSEADSSVEPPGSTGTRSAEQTIAELEAAGRVDITAEGNRVIEGRGALFDNEQLTLDAPVRGMNAVWIAASGTSQWVIISADGSIDIMSTIADDQTVVEPVQADPFHPVLGPPLVGGPSGATLVEGHDLHRSLFTDPLPDTRVTTDGSRLVAIGGPTDRYPHGVLGDDLEGSTIEVIEGDGSTKTPVRIDDPDVFEAVSPMLADVDGDGDSDAVMTVSNADTGARLVAYDLTDGAVIGESEPIGQGNRWRNLLAVAPTGPAGETEVIDIRTPHIGGTLQFFQLIEGRLELVASAESYSTHRIGSRNLDLGIVTDADGDGRLDVLLPTQDKTELAVVTRDENGDSGTREVGRLALGGEITSNIAAATTAQGVAYAVGVSDGTIRFWLP